MASNLASWAEPIPYDPEGKEESELLDDLREYNSRATSFEILISRLQARLSSLRRVIYTITAALGRTGELTQVETTVMRNLEPPSTEGVQGDRSSPDTSSTVLP